MKTDLAVTESLANRAMTEAAVQALETACDNLGEDAAVQIASAFISRIADARALRDVVAWAHSREEAFIGRHPVDSRTDQAKVPASGWMGYWSQWDWESIDFFPHVLNKVLRDLGYDPDAVLRRWRDRGWIAAEQGRYTTKVNINGEDPDVSMVSVLRKAVQEAA